MRKLKKLGYIEDDSLTWKGRFSSRVYADEITMGELFATDMIQELTEYQILLILGCLVYEPKEQHLFTSQYKTEALRHLKGILRKRESLHYEKKFLELDTITALIHPLYNGKDFFELLKGTNLSEGDLIRFCTQLLDRIGQIKKATNEEGVLQKMNHCKEMVEKTLRGIYLV